MTPSSRVASRYLARTARATEDYTRLENAFKAFTEPFRQACLVAAHPWKRDGVVPDDVAANVAREARVLLNVLVIEFENERLEERASHYLTRVKNLRKMLTAYATAPDGQALTDVIKSQGTRSKGAWEKYWEYKEEALAVVNSFDVEQEGSRHVGGFHAVLLTAPRADWTEEAVGKLDWLLRTADKLLSKAGLSGMANGTNVMAYPTGYLPPSAGAGSSTLAMYRRTDDFMWLAVGGNERRVLQSLVHEVGHRVYWKLMGSVGQASWGEFFEGNKGAPDLGMILGAWDRYLVSKGDYGDAQRWGRYFTYFIPWARKHEPEVAVWAEIVHHELGVDEKFDGITGAPKKGSPVGRDVLEARANEVKVFMEPVTAYSATEPGELFAEAFAHALVHGPGRLSERVRSALQEAVPRLKLGSNGYPSVGTTTVDADGIPLKYPSQLLRTQADYGEGRAMLPRGLDDEVGLAQEFLRALGQKVASRHLLTHA